jgi:hypothetical protein
LRLLWGTVNRSEGDDLKVEGQQPAAASPAELSGGEGDAGAEVCCFWRERCDGLPE